MNGRADQNRPSMLLLPLRARCPTAYGQLLIDGFGGWSPYRLLQYGGLPNPPCLCDIHNEANAVEVTSSV